MFLEQILDDILHDNIFLQIKIDFLFLGIRLFGP